MNILLLLIPPEWFSRLIPTINPTLVNYLIWPLVQIAVVLVL